MNLPKQAWGKAKMRPSMKHVSRLLALAAVVACIAGAPARAQDYPARPITIIVPFAPGGAADITTRLLGQKLGERLGKAIVIDNRAGAGTVIGAAAAAKAAPDGYTLFMGGSASLAVQVTLRKQIPYDPARDFVPLAQIAAIPFVLVVHPSLPVHSVADLVKLGKEKPLTIATSGPGSPAHLCAELLRSLTGIGVNYVPYRGSAPAITDFLAGTVPVMFVEFPASLALIREGRMRPLGVSSPARVAAAPDIAPLAEAGVPGYEAGGWLMMVAPADTPKDIVARLHGELKGVVADADVKRQLNEMGQVPIDTLPVDRLPAYVASEIARWGKIMRDAGIAGSE
jgi:tripartite-type tricarboxylate transporter receptor subunit TctC